MYNDACWVTFREAVAMPKYKVPIIENHLLKLNDSEVRVGSEKWYDWLDANNKFKYKGVGGHILA